MSDLFSDDAGAAAPACMEEHAAGIYQQMRDALHDLRRALSVADRRIENGAHPHTARKDLVAPALLDIAELADKLRAAL